MAFTASTWRDRASILALVAGVVSVAVLVVEGPPGSGYGWGSVVISAGIVAGLFVAMAYLVRSDTPSRAWASAAVAVLIVVMSCAALIGNWGVESAGFRALDTIATLIAVAASGVVFMVAVATVRHSGSPAL
jgi:peptidoglycan/LPS O-acetylase OafA/YrhL